MNVKATVESISFMVTPEDGGEPIEGYVAEGEIQQWLLADRGARSAPREVDRGWRLRLEHEDGEGHVELMEEQVFPERVLKSANVVKCQRKGVRFNLEEAKWLREKLERYIIPILENQLLDPETGDVEDL